VKIRVIESEDSYAIDEVCYMPPILVPIFVLA